MSDKEITKESPYSESTNGCLPHKDSSLRTKIYFWVQNHFIIYAFWEN